MNTSTHTHLHTCTVKHTLTWGGNPGLGKLLVGLTWLGGGPSNLRPGWGGILWEVEPPCRGPGMVLCSRTLWYHGHDGGGGWGCQWACGLSLSTCIWSWARVLWGAPMAKLWGEPEGPCPGWEIWWGIPWNPPSWGPGTVSTTKEPEGTYTQIWDEHNK